MKNRAIAIVLALFLGGFGIHRLYLGQTTTCIVMFLFSWTFIPAFIAVVDIVRFLVMGEAEFQKRYSTPV